MKKLVMFIAVAFVAVGVQAATLTWTITNVIGSDGNDAAAGNLVALYAASTAYDHDAAVAGTLVPTYSTTTVAMGTTGAMRASQSGVGSYSAGDVASFYAVVYDASTIAGASNYIVSDVISATVGSAGANISLSYGSMKGTTTGNRFKTALDAGGWTSAGTPEPTSGLLLLIGAGLLGLRRKRA